MQKSPPTEIFDAPLPPTGALLRGRYKVDVVHRAGGMGVVFCGWDGVKSQAIAIKTVRPGCPREVVDRFILEADIEVPDDPCLAQTLGHFSENRRPYQIQEFIPGRSLLEILQSREDAGSPADDSELPWFNPITARRIAAQSMVGVARGLEKLHQSGTIHRDLKPANLVWHKDGRAVVVDFGLAWQTNRRHESMHTGRVIGTAGFASPEQCEGRVADARSDVYSLGATLWALLPGSPLLECGDPSARPDLAPPLANALFTALERNPINRFQSAGEFADALDGWLHSSADDAARPPLRTSLRRWMIRHHYRLAVAASIIFGLLSILLARAWWQESREAASTAAASWQAQLGRAHEAGGRLENYLQRHDQPEDDAMERDLSELLKMVSADELMIGEETHRSRRTALKFLLMTERAQEAGQYLLTWPKLDSSWAEFEDFRLEASVASGANDFDKAIQMLEEGARIWPENSELAEAVRGVLRQLDPKQARSYPWRCDGIFREGLHDTRAIVNENGGVVAISMSPDGDEIRTQISPPGFFASDRGAYGYRVESGCRIHRNGVAVGSLLHYYADENSDPPGGVYLQDLDPTKNPELVLRRKTSPSVWTGGMVAADLLGDGQDEVILPLVNTNGGAAILRLQGTRWHVYHLPISGNDVHGVEVVPAKNGGSARFWLATSLWDIQNQGYRLHQFSIEAKGDGLLLHRHSKLPIGATENFSKLRGWPAPAYASFGPMDAAIAFGGDFRSARSNQIWLLREHEGHGLCPDQLLWSTPKPSVSLKESVYSNAIDIDADGRDEIHFGWSWLKHRGTGFAVCDSEGRTLTLALPWAMDMSRALRNLGQGTDALLLGMSTKESLMFPGKRGVSSPGFLSLLAPDSEFQQVVLPRFGGVALESSFEIGNSWKPGDTDNWYTAGFRISHADFNSGASLIIESSNENQKMRAALELTTQGGGGIYYHYLERSSAGKIGEVRHDDPKLILIPGGWVTMQIHASSDGKGMVVDAVQEISTPGGGKGASFPIPIPPTPGSSYRIYWRPHATNRHVEPRDHFAVLALEWKEEVAAGGIKYDLQAGTIHQDGAIQELFDVEQLYAQLQSSAKRGDFKSFSMAKSALESLAPSSRGDTHTDKERNGLAAYRLESAPLWLMSSKVDFSQTALEKKNLENDAAD